MIQLWKDVLVSAIMGLVLPAMVVNFCTAQLPEREEPPPETTVHQRVSSPVYLRQADSVMEMDMDAYLVGVVLAEMPASFEPEALKAQAVVARTYARKAFLTGGKHDDGSVCAEPSCCQGYRAEADYLSDGGSPESVSKVRAAVMETFGLVLTYEGELIEATYFSCSGGRTEDAAAVWGAEYPYLRSVDSPGEETAAYYTDAVSFRADELAELLSLDTGRPQFGKILRTEGGGVDTMQISGKTFRGTELRTLLGLRSTAFDVAVEGNTVTFTTRGYGHRVGMSQYGADAMGTLGCSFREILEHYYPGTVLAEIG